MRESADLIINAIRLGHLVFICGNGGSATQSLHFSGELLGKFKYDRVALPCISLVAETAALTAIANDFGYEHIFSRQLEGLAKKGDVLIALSTSGRSKNVLNAIDFAEGLGMEVVDLPRKGVDTVERQENHLGMLHELAGLIEEEFK